MAVIGTSVLHFVAHRKATGVIAAQRSRSEVMPAS